MSDILQQEELDALFSALKDGDIEIPEPEKKEDDVDQDALAAEWEQQLSMDSGVDMDEFGELVQEETARPVSSGKKDYPRELKVLLNIDLDVAVEMGRTRMAVYEILRLSQGKTIQLDRDANSYLSFMVNNVEVARGEAVVTNDNFGLRIKEIGSLKERLEKL